MSESPRPKIELTTPLADVPGVGFSRARILRRLGLRTLRDVLLNFPRDWEDLSTVRTIPTLQEGELCALPCRVVEWELRNTGPGRTILGVLVEQDKKFARAVWFNQPHMAGKFERRQLIVLEGKPKQNGLRWEFHHPKVRVPDNEEAVGSGRLLPVYRLTEGVSQAQMRRLMRSCVGRFADLIEEPLPDAFRQRLELPAMTDTIRAMHFPETKPVRDAARRRLAFQELLVMQLALALRRRQSTDARAPVLGSSARLDARIRRLLPFELTEGQRQAIREVCEDLAREKPMNRLVQGDVGSGKTVVAVYAMLVAVAGEHQAVLMAPTEVLARQHWHSVDRLLQASRVRRALLTGAVPTAERERILAQLAAGELDLVVGTQALLSERVSFAKLGLVVIDEQHKFGVRQRAGLRTTSGQQPHVLIMSATPIPRTVGLTLYGDLDVTTIRDRPPGRAPVFTYFVGDDHRDRWWAFVRKHLDAGRQAYVIGPRVRQLAAEPDSPAEPDTAADATKAAPPKSVEEIYDELAAGPLAGYRLGLVHGQLTSQDKQQALRSFRDGWTQVLVATTVVEVGVDVPNATLMTIEEGQRFGLATLHQLRGRISRGTHEGFCTVFASTDDPIGHKRLTAFAETTDGFALAELDFQLRGPGSFLGTRQHGLPPLFVADLVADAPLVELSRDEAAAILSDTTGWQESWSALRRIVLRKYGSVFDLGDVG